MRLLADSHAVHWWLLGAPRLSRRAHASMVDPDNDVLVSSASIYELAFKQRLGKLEGDPADLLPAIKQARFTLLPILPEHSLRAAKLPGPHRDPWDRILIAQAMEGRLTVATADPVFADYGVKVLW